MVQVCAKAFCLAADSLSTPDARHVQISHKMLSQRCSQQRQANFLSQNVIQLLACREQTYAPGCMLRSVFVSIHHSVCRANSLDIPLQALSLCSRTNLAGRAFIAESLASCKFQVHTSCALYLFGNSSFRAQQPGDCLQESEDGLRCCRVRLRLLM